MVLLVDALIFEYKKAPGYETFLFNLLTYLFNHRDLIRANNVKIAVKAGQEKHFERFCSKFEIISFKFNSHLGLFLAQNLLKKKCSLRAADVVLHTYNYGSAIKQAKTITVVHDLQFMRFPEYWSTIKLLQRKLQIPRTLKLADRIIAISNFTKQELEFFYGAWIHKTAVIYNFCDFEKFWECEQSVNSSVSAGSEYFLSVSSMARHKNIFCLLVAFSLYVKFNKNCKLVLVGKYDNLDKSAHEFIESNGLNDCVQFTGYISASELGTLYKKCLATILPTLYEGFGLPIVEALYFDCRLILSDIPICREIAEDSAVFFDPSDPRDLLEKMKNVNNMSSINSSKQRVIQKYAKENTGALYIESINQLLLEEI